MSGASAPSFAQVLRGELGGTSAPAGPVGAALFAVPTGLNPALNGGVPSIQGLLAPTLSAPSTLIPAQAAVPAAAVPAPAAITALSGLSARVLPAASAEGGDAAKAASNEAFDGVAPREADDAEPLTAADGSPLGQLYPRVVFIQDVFSGPASENSVKYVNTLVKAGVHVVFLTWRPLKGAGSAEEILLSRVKQSRNNPVIVVSYNGGKITLHGRAANPTSLIENVGAFPADALAKIKGVVESFSQEAGGSASLEASPTDKEAFSLRIRVDAPVDAGGRVSPSAQAAALNEKLQNAGLSYKAEAHPSGDGSLILHSMPLRFSLARVMQALDTQFAGENIPGNPDKFLILADSEKSPRFSTSFPPKSELQVVKDGGAIEIVLGDVLGDRKLKPVSIKFAKLRQFVEYWEPRHVAVPSPGRSEGWSGGGGSQGGDRQTRRMLSGYVGTIISSLMAQAYDDVFQGQDHLARLTALQAKLGEMWYNPLKYGVWISQEMARGMADPAFKSMSKGFLRYANQFLVDFYLREFGDFSRAMAVIRDTYVGLSTDGKSLITIMLRSAATGQLFKIYIRIPRTMKHYDAVGLSLTAHVYRTGKESPNDGEEFLARTYALALLYGHGRKGADGKWHYGSPTGPLLSSLNVQFESRGTARIKTFSAEEFLSIEEGKEVNGPLAQDLISAILRQEASAEFQEFYKLQEETATQEDLKKAKLAAAAASKAAKKRVKKPVKTKRAGRGK